MRASTSVSQASGSTPFSLAVTIRVYIIAARSPPRSEPTNSHAFPPRATLRSSRSAALFVRQSVIPPQQINSGGVDPNNPIG